MADIPVEPTRTGTPWWLWLLGLLLLAGLLWFLLEAFDDDDDVAVADDVEVVDDVDVIDDDVSVAGPVTAGAAMDMSNLYVTRVPGDRTFFVAPTAGSSDETLVILDQTASPGAPGIEGQVDINPGQTVDLSDGRMEALGDMDLLNMGLSDDELNMMTPTTQVIRIDGGDVEISNADLQNVEVGEG